MALGVGLAGTNTLTILLAVGYGFASAFAEPAAQILFMLYFAALWLSFSLAAVMEIYHLHLTSQLRAPGKTGRLLALGPLVSAGGLLLIPGAPPLLSIAGGAIVLATSLIFTLYLLLGLWLARRAAPH